MSTRLHPTPETRLRDYSVMLDHWSPDDQDSNLMRDARADLATADLTAAQRQELTRLDARAEALLAEHGGIGGFDVAMLTETVQIAREHPALRAA